MRNVRTYILKESIKCVILQIIKVYVPVRHLAHTECYLLIMIHRLYMCRVVLCVWYCSTRNSLHIVYN